MTQRIIEVARDGFHDGVVTGTTENVYVCEDDELGFKADPETNARLYVNEWMSVPLSTTPLYFRVKKSTGRPGSPPAPNGASAQQYYKLSFVVDGSEKSLTVWINRVEQDVGNKLWHHQGGVVTAEFSRYANVYFRFATNGQQINSFDGLGSIRSLMNDGVGYVAQLAARKNDDVITCHGFAVDTIHFPEGSYKLATQNSIPRGHGGGNEGGSTIDIKVNN